MWNICNLKIKWSVCLKYHLQILKSNLVFYRRQKQRRLLTLLFIFATLLKIRLLFTVEIYYEMY